MDWHLKRADLKRYPHFDQVLSISEASALVTNPTRVAQNAFYPLLLYTKNWQPFRKRVGTQAKPKAKIRPIRYAARRDAYIFSYYRYLLSVPYEEELTRLGISQCPVAYRRLARSDKPLQGKCNIQFAHEAFNAIRCLGDCFAITVDISSYFESIDHERLKALWCRLLKVKRLPPDHFAVFKNITRYSVVDRTEAYTRLGFFGVKKTTKGGHPILGYLRAFKDVPVQLCSPKEFRQKILGENGQYSSLVTQNKMPYGIPQGAPISDLLANLYLIDFDVEMNVLAKSFGGTYVRYSDDILLIVKASAEDARMIMESLPGRIAAHGEMMLIKPEKSSLVKYTQAHDRQISEVVVGKGRNGLEYLGFRFDGKDVFLRDSTISNLYRKVASAARNQATATVKRYPGKSEKELIERFDFEQFSKRFGRVEDFEDCSGVRSWTFWTYVVRARDEFGPLGSKIMGQLKRMKTHSRARVKAELNRAISRHEKN